MKLWFENSLGKARIIAKIDGRKRKKDVQDETMKHINSFCEQHNYKIPYVRMWVDEWHGKQVQVYDVGSHTEFFYLTGCQIK